ncbi:MAG: UDP-N-acetylmuramoyl-tripeptide--D-alanyl-D-alanine ligase [Clostridia bacterium]
MEKLTLTEIAEYTNGKQVGNAMISNISIDSREIGENCLFIGVKGDKFDGNDFVDVAVTNGAKAVLTIKDVCNVPQVKVADSNKALLEMAKGYKGKMRHLKTVAVTGSAGKTTTKEMIHSVLCEMGETHKNKGNLNNHIGVPLTLFGLHKKHEYAVIEMGMNHKGEIKVLSDTVCPDLAVITNIGISHIEYLGSREGILNAKLEILSGLKGKIILNGDEPLLRDIKIKNDVIYFGLESENLDITCKNIEEFEDYTQFTAICFGRELDIKINALGKHNVINALAAIAVANEFSATDEQIKRGLYAFENTGMRQNIFEYNGYKVIEDCYNASPDSCKAALSVLEKTKANKKIAVLGAMGELGNFSNEAHKAVLAQALKSADLICLFGDAWRKVEVFDAKIYDNKQVLALELSQKIKEGDAVLFKGSRAQKMEEVLKLLMNEEK